MSMSSDCTCESSRSSPRGRESSKHSCMQLIACPLSVIELSEAFMTTKTDHEDFEFHASSSSRSIAN